METISLTQIKFVIQAKNNWQFFTRLISLILMLLSLNCYSFNLLLTKKQTNVVPMFRVQMSGVPNYLDECVIYYHAGATNGFDNAYDAYKLVGSNSAPHISIDNDTLMLVLESSQKYVNENTEGIPSESNNKLD